MDKTPDVAQLSYCCGKRLVWTSTTSESGEVDGWGGRCPDCGTEWGTLSKPARLLLPTERLLLARIAELEEARRWRVTAEEMPPVGVDVVGDWGDCTWPCAVARWDGSWWHTEETAGVVPPDRWSPLPGVPEISQGADVPKEA
jgi:hypothetical protein